MRVSNPLILLLFINLLIRVCSFLLAGCLEGKSDRLDETLLGETFEESMSAPEVSMMHLLLVTPPGHCVSTTLCAALCSFSFIPTPEPLCAVLSSPAVISGCSCGGLRPWGLLPPACCPPAGPRGRRSPGAGGAVLLQRPLLLRHRDLRGHEGAGGGGGGGGGAGGTSRQPGVLPGDLLQQSVHLHGGGDR